MGGQLGEGGGGRGGGGNFGATGIFLGHSMNNF